MYLHPALPSPHVRTHKIEAVIASPTRILLGTAVLLQAGVMLRYVSYFKEFNVSWCIIQGGGLR